MCIENDDWRVFQPLRQPAPGPDLAPCTPLAYFALPRRLVAPVADFDRGGAPVILEDY
jgi:hypothetical protein